MPPNLPRSSNFNLTAKRMLAVLTWLNTNPILAAREYNLLHHKLCTLFDKRGCRMFEEFADRTFDRIGELLAQKGKVPADAEPTAFACSVAQNLVHDCYRMQTDRLKEEKVIEDTNAGDTSEHHASLDLMDEALRKLPEHERNLLVEYYRNGRLPDHARRREMARRLGKSPEALRLEVYRIVQKVRGFYNKKVKPR